MNHRFLFLPLFLFLHVSCSSSNDNSVEENAISTYELAKVDSIIVNFMEEIHLLDYDTERDIFLGYNQRSGDYIEFDREGEILNQVNLLGDGPNDHGGTGSYQVNYLGDGKIGVAGVGRYYIYDQNWQLIDKIDYQPMKGAYIIMAGGSIAYLTNSRPQAKNASTTTILGSGFFVLKKEDHKNPFLFSLDLETANVTPYHFLPDSSLYLTSSTFYPSLADVIISYNYERQVLELIHKLEPVIYTYDVATNPPQFLSSTQFEYDNPNELKGATYDIPVENIIGNTLYESLNQIFTGFYSFDDRQLIQYRERKAGAELISANETDQEKLREFGNSKANTWAYLIKDGKRISHDFPMAEPMIGLQLGNGQFLSTNYIDPNIERDSQLFYIYELQNVEN